MLRSISTGKTDTLIALQLHRTCDAPILLAELVETKRSLTIPAYRFKTVTLVTPRPGSKPPRLCGHHILDDLESAPCLERIESRAPARLMEFLSEFVQPSFMKIPFLLKVRTLSIEQKEFAMAMLCPNLEYLCFHNIGVGEGPSLPLPAVLASHLAPPPLVAAPTKVTHLEIQAPWDLTWMKCTFNSFSSSRTSS